MSRINAERFNELKARVKAECQRRCHYGSVSSYAGSAYDYTVTPSEGGVVKQEHRDKIAIPLNAINKNNVQTASGQQVVLEDDLLVMEAFTTTLESRDVYDDYGTDCASSCTGMCYGCSGTCYDECTGCSDSCYGSCDGGCSGDCDGSCTLTCGNFCSFDCFGSCQDQCSSCTGGCDYVCGSSCSDDCSGSCWNGCTEACEATCSDSCGGCEDYCRTTCYNVCVAVNTK